MNPKIEEAVVTKRVAENEKYTPGKISQIVGEYFFAVRNGGLPKKNEDRLPRDLPEHLRPELESTFSFIDSLVKLRKIEQGEPL